MNTEQEILNGCGIQENSWKSSLCKKNNLCSDCQDVLKWYRRGRKDAIEEFSEKLKEELLEEGKRIFATGKGKYKSMNECIDKIKKELQ